VVEDEAHLGRNPSVDGGCAHAFGRARLQNW
jgi:hypothetical protein